MRRGWLTLRVELQTVGWVPLVASAVPLLVAAGLAGGQAPSFIDRALLTRLSVAFPAVVLPYVLDDRAGELTAALPTSPLIRNLVRLATVGVAWLAAVVAALLLASRNTPWTFVAGTDPAAFPVGRLLLEAGALAAAGALGAAFSARWWEEDLRMVIAAIVALLFVVAAAAPPEWTPFQAPGSTRWEAAGKFLGSWIGVCLVGSLVIGSGRGPLVPPPRRAHRRRHR